MWLPSPECSEPWESSCPWGTTSHIEAKEGRLRELLFFHRGMIPPYEVNTGIGHSTDGKADLQISRALERRLVTASGSREALSMPGLSSARAWAVKRAEVFS